jgi:hypothetical protein
VSFQDLFLILSRCVDLELLTVTAAFRAAGDLEKILGSGFEMIRISQCDVTAGFSEFMIKKGQIGDQIDDHNRGDFGVIQKLLAPGLRPKSGSHTQSVQWAIQTGGAHPSSLRVE